MRHIDRRGRRHIGRAGGGAIGRLGRRHAALLAGAGGGILRLAARGSGRRPVMARLSRAVAPASARFPHGFRKVPQGPVATRYFASAGVNHVP